MLCLVLSFINQYIFNKSVKVFELFSHLQTLGGHSAPKLAWTQIFDIFYLTSYCTLHKKN